MMVVLWVLLQFGLALGVGGEVVAEPSELRAVDSCGHAIEPPGAARCSGGLTVDDIIAAYERPPTGLNRERLMEALAEVRPALRACARFAADPPMTVLVRVKIACDGRLLEARVAGGVPGTSRAGACIVRAFRDGLHLPPLGRPAALLHIPIALHPAHRQ